MIAYHSKRQSHCRYREIAEEHLKIGQIEGNDPEEHCTRKEGRDKYSPARKYPERENNLDDAEGMEKQMDRHPTPQQH